MAGETYLGGGCYRNDCGEETVDPLPILVFGHDPRQGGRRLRIGPAPAKGLVARTGAPRFPLGARDAQKAEIVLSRENPGSSEPLDQAAQTIDLTLPFRTLASRMCSLSPGSIGPDEIGNCTMSSDRPKNST